ncbi:MAG: phosphatidate cytidylyltransferase [Peptostreptococcaceae bacterium]|nr:phosphatidate cytidylyltransferase [Peptostreptococcaceae bacterium]
MLVRIISSIALLPLLFLVILKGGVFIYIGGTICSLMALYEYFRVFEKNNYKPMTFISYLLTIIMYSMISLSSLQFSHIVINMLYLLVASGAYLIITRKIRIEDLMVSVLGFVYIPVFLSHINLLSQMGTIYIWLVFIFAWVSDISAYFSGMFFGKHKLIPEISPKKTVEGAIGGIAGTVIFTVGFAMFFKEPSPMHFVPLAIVGSVVSQLGDLFASAIKRALQIKDYGNIIPGHGGVLDRFDSILFTAPLTYYGITLIEFMKHLSA